MLKRVVHLSAACLLLPLFACAGAPDDDGGTFGSFASFTMGQTTASDDMDDMDDMADMETSGDGDSTTGDGDGDAGTGDGDGEPTETGDGDGEGDGDGDQTTGDGDGDGDPEPGPNCGNGMIDPGETCDGSNFGGVTCVDLGYDMGSLTCNGCAVSTASCVNAPQPGLGQLYSHCLDANGCPGLDGCATVSMDGQETPFDGYCTNFCSGNAECFADTGGNAVPQCNDVQPNSYCELDCSSGKTCPGGMVCTSLIGGKQLCY